MRILYHHRTRSNDGQQVHVQGLVGALRRAGHEVEVVAPRPRRDEPRRANSNQDATASPGDSGPPRASRLRELAELAYNLVESRQLSRAAARFRPDAVYSRHALYSNAAAKVAARIGLPLVVEVNAPLALERGRHGGLAFPDFARRHETETLNRADRVVVVTQAMGELLVAQGVRREKLEVHWNGLEPEALTRSFDAAAVRARLDLEDRIVLGFVGFVRDWNRLERTFPFLVREPRALLLVVGDGPDRPRLEREAAKAGVAERVRFAGTVAREAVLDHVATFDVALLPEVTEYASPLKLLDYFAASRAVLAPDRANLREVVTSGENALLFDPDREGDFDEKLRTLVASPLMREWLGVAGRATIEKLGLTWDHNAQRVVAAFEAAIAARRREVVPR